jgi:hypothetical protein
MFSPMLAAGLRARPLETFQDAADIAGIQALGLGLSPRIKQSRNSK